jgi:hypothetical protein
MRYLNKVVFINSATIKYAEVNLDGNVHLIGTQGVGKSTLLRSILFFYNADTQKLGIAKEKKNYAEYYFPYANSYVVYEVNTEAGPFCILSFKSQGRVSFRFFDGAYQQKYFIGPDQSVFDSWDQTRAILDAGKIKYSNKIDRYEEYKDILYGNTDGKNNALKKYALLESKQYQNIPRTIQNVLLNSKLDAEFIKQTIIMSLNEEDIQIELNNYTHHLKGFETQLNDIKQFKLPSVTKQADTVALLLSQYKTLEREKITLTGYLAWAHQHDLDNQPKLKDKLDKEEEAKQLIIEKLDKALIAYQEKETEKRNKISIFDNDLKTAKKRADEYERINIKNIIARVAKKNEHEAEEKNLLAEREILSAQYKDITKKYEALIKEIESQLVEYKNTRGNEKIELSNTFQNFQNDLRLQSDKQVNEISEQFKVEIQAAKEQVTARNEETQALKINKEGIKHRRYFDEELENLNNDLREHNTNLLKATSQIKLLKAEIEMLQKQWNSEIDRKQETFQAQNEKLDEKIKTHLAAIAVIETKIANNKNSLYGWLDEQHPKWANTIGKVIDEELLFQNNLSPELSKKTEGSLYGITLNLNQINKKVKTFADYEDEKAALAKQVDKLRKEQNELIDNHAAEGEKLRKKYQSKINQTKDTIQEQEYFHSVTHNHINQTTLSLSDYLARGKAEKQQALADIDVSIHKAEKNEGEAKAELVKVEEEQKKKIKAKEKETDNRIKVERLVLTEALALIDSAILEKITSHQENKTNLLNKQKSELSEKGADTKRIDAVNQHLATIKEELVFIDKNRDKVAEYQKDKRELFDKVEENKTQKQLLEQQLAIETQKYQARKDEIQKSLKTVNDTIKGIEQKLEEIKRDVDAFDKFTLTDSWMLIPDIHKEVREKNKTTKSASELIMELIQSHATSGNRLADLKAAINKFTSYFSAQNIFKFKTIFTETEQFLQFADELRNFMEEAKISEYEKRTNEQYASVIRSIGHETTNLVSKSGEIKKIITQINNDFERKNFVGAIKKIELNIDESANKIVQLLIKIKTFNDEHSFDLGASNLFTSDGQESKNKQATELLKQLLKEITDFKRDHISLSDSFELKFRVVENQNDTGWVEKLSNVGSEGTDILVKAMVNIMLLNVFKEGASKRFKDFRLHCMMDEIGKLHPNNVKGILQFANDRNIYLINGSPTENNAVNYKHIYKLEKDDKSFTRVKRILTNHA